MEKDINKKVLVKDVLKITKGQLLCGNPEEEIRNITNNTEDITKGDFFIGLIGSKNGGIYFENAFEKDAKGVILQDIEITKEQQDKYKDKVIIKVENTLIALQKIAEYKRSMYNIPIVAVTGSVGKTSTKDIVANVISQKYNTLKTEGNYNNEIGVPLTLLRLENHEAAVVEMGMNHLGEISFLSNLTRPTLCVITNVGTAHIGNLGSRQNILKAKLEILDGNKEKELVLNNDNDMLNMFNTTKNNDINIISYGIEEKSDIYATDIIEKEESSSFICHIKEEAFKVEIPVAGRHFIYNALCAAAVGNKLGLNNEEIKKGIETFKLTKKRMDIDVLKNDIKIINDSYNASYESMKGALENLSRYKTRRIAVLGDMFELGEYSEEMHRKVGKEVVENNIDILMCAGESSKYIAEQAKQDGMKDENIYYFEDKEEIYTKLKNIIKKDDVILFKASNGMKFFELVERLKKEDV